MSSKYLRYLGAVGLTVIFVAFQNCGPAPKMANYQGAEGGPGTEVELQDLQADEKVLHSQALELSEVIAAEENPDKEAHEGDDKNSAVAASTSSASATSNIIIEELGLREGSGGHAEIYGRLRHTFGESTVSPISYSYRKYSRFKKQNVGAWSEVIPTNKPDNSAPSTFVLPIPSQPTQGVDTYLFRFYTCAAIGSCSVDTNAAVGLFFSFNVRGVISPNQDQIVDKFLGAGKVQPIHVVTSQLGYWPKLVVKLKKSNASEICSAEFNQEFDLIAPVQEVYNPLPFSHIFKLTEKNPNCKIVQTLSQFHVVIEAWDPIVDPNRPLYVTSFVDGKIIRPAVPTGPTPPATGPTPPNTEPTPVGPTANIIIDQIARPPWNQNKVTMVICDQQRRNGIKFVCEYKSGTSFVPCAGVPQTVSTVAGGGCAYNDVGSSGVTNTTVRVKPEGASTWTSTCAYSGSGVASCD